MTKQEYIEKELVEKSKHMQLNVHNRSTVRDILGKEWDFWEREARDYSPYDAGEINKGDIKEYYE